MKTIWQSFTLVYKDIDFLFSVVGGYQTLLSYMSIKCYVNFYKQMVSYFSMFSPSSLSHPSISGKNKFYSSAFCFPDTLFLSAVFIVLFFTFFCAAPEASAEEVLSQQECCQVSLNRCRKWGKHFRSLRKHFPGTLLLGCIRCLR